MATFRQRRMLGEAPYGSSKVAFSTAGNLLAAASPAGTITLWDAKSLREVATLQAPQGQQQQHFSVSSISISPDEQLLLAACKAPALLLLYSVQDRRLQCALRLAADMFGLVQAQVLPDSTSAAGRAPSAYCALAH
jgi:WD40 repeat protein